MELRKRDISLDEIKDDVAYFGILDNSIEAMFKVYFDCKYVYEKSDDTIGFQGGYKNTRLNILGVTSATDIRTNENVCPVIIDKKILISEIEKYIQNEELEKNYI